jgi:hypothetical protein
LVIKNNSNQSEIIVQLKNIIPNLYWIFLNFFTE